MPRSTPPRILPLDAVEREHLPHVGGKAANLSRLARAGLPVPAGFVLTRWAYDSIRAELSTDASKGHSPTVETSLRDEVGRALARLWRDGAAPLPVMVRSSAHGEDGAHRSYAGIFESYSATGKLDDVIGKIELCWASHASDRAAAYRGGPPDPDDYMAVLVHLRVDARLAGVTFTRDPTGGAAVSLTEVVRGDGARLVDGTADAWRFRVERTEPHEAVAVGSNTAGQDNGEAPDVLPTLLADVERLGLDAERLLGEPQDMEWVLGPEDLWVVQSRPIPGMSAPAEGPVGEPARAPSVTPPAGFVPALDEPFTSFGIWLELAKAPRYERAVRWIKGPGSIWQVRFVDHRLHVREKSTLFDRAWERLAAPVQWVTCESILEDYLTAERQYGARLDAQKLRALGADDLQTRLAALDELIETYLSFAGTDSIMAGHLANLMSGLLTRICAIIDPSDSTAARELLLGVSSLVNERDAALWNAARTVDSAGQEEVLDAWDRRFGYVWADHNAKDPGWRIDTSRRAALLDQLRQASAQDAPAARLAAGRQRAVAAERHFAARLSHRPAWQRTPLRGLFRLVLRQARLFFPLREARNHAFYQGVMAIGEVTALLGKDMFSAGSLASHDDVFNLSRPEIAELLAGGSHLRSQAIDRRTTPSHRNPPHLASAVSPSPVHEIEGIPAARGIVEGVAHVIIDWDKGRRLRRNEILVCPAIRPYLTPLMLIASGLVTDRGSALSHGANLAREYGIPAVLAARDATSLIASGDRIRVDGNTGRVTIIARAGGAAS